MKPFAVLYLILGITFLIGLADGITNAYGAYVTSSIIEVLSPEPPQKEELLGEREKLISNSMAGFGIAFFQAVGLFYVRRLTKEEAEHSMTSSHPDT